MPDTAEWTLDNFTMAEVACKCCDVSFMSARFMIKMQLARDYLGLPIYGNSWCRCKDNNRIAGGKLSSSHLIVSESGIMACAGDVTLVNPAERIPMSSYQRYALETALREAGFNRFGHHNWFIHVDDDPKKAAKVIWLY
jgi:hypothetical protein